MVDINFIDGQLSEYYWHHFGSSTTKVFFFFLAELDPCQCGVKKTLSHWLSVFVMKVIANQNGLSGRQQQLSKASPCDVQKMEGKQLPVLVNYLLVNKVFLAVK